MPANIYQNQFVAAREPAWHRAGVVVPEPIPVREAIYVTGKPLPVVEKRQLLWPDGTPSPYYGLGRVGVNDAIEKAFGVVSNGYRLVTPEEFVTAWEVATDNAPIETFGVLGEGDTMFITCPMPGWELKGDEMRRFMVASNFMDGQTANGFTTVDFRVVCENTLKAALGDVASTFRVAHDQDAINSIVGWLSDCYHSAKEKAEVMTEVLTILAERKLDREDVLQTLAVAVPIPTTPKPSGSPVYDAQRAETWEKRAAQVQTERSVIRSLYDGGGIGSTTVAAAGTAFGLYNAIAEAYEYIIPSTNATIAAESFLFGSRGYAVQRGFNYLVNLSRN